MTTIELALKHYPAPWTAAEGDCYLAVAAKDSKSLIYIDSKPSRNREAKSAMLKLVAAAPQLAIALKGFLNAYDPPAPFEMIFEHLDTAAEIAREALALIEGEVQEDAPEKPEAKPAPFKGGDKLKKWEPLRGRKELP